VGLPELAPPKCGNLCNDLYAWAERAKLCGYPERFAQEALGHNSKAVHRAYAKRALMKLPSLQEYEERAALTAATTV